MMSNSYNILNPAVSDPAIVKEIGKSLQRLRLYKNMSQQQLADKAGLDRTTISRTEAGRAATLLTLVQVLRALNELHMLSSLIWEQERSPLQLLREQEHQKKYASHKRKPFQKPDSDII